ncbi:MAG: cyclase, partial [Thermoplasmata archaeon]|nr:cyclase [Thermoplasmata archaeon]NIS13313.1 cyclase [Thermoplasmata archaeon]NIS21211.1 cyclase [Thermoplasmata archaeon]NIT78705.1 cyclase [Thermoplasmata archaeon]NIU50265.1 cyclase [Thermoplasmata archaeon]
LPDEEGPTEEPEDEPAEEPDDEAGEAHGSDEEPGKRDDSYYEDLLERELKRI